MIQRNGENYAVIREFNMTKKNIFPEEMINDAQKAITLFIKKPENPVVIGKNDELLLAKIEIVLDTII